MEEKVTPEEIEEYQEDQKIEGEETEEDRMMTQQELAEAYGSPEPEEKQNQHSFLHKAAFLSGDTVRTTFLSESELGRPLFSVRFLLDMEDVSIHYLDGFAEKCEGTNRIAIYFRNKVLNITDSGMSNKGFAMNLNVTRKMDTTRTRVKGNIENLQKGGKKRR